MTARYWPVVFRLKIDLGDLEPALAGVDALAESLRDLPLPPAARATMEKLNIVRAVHGTTGIEGNTMSEGAVADVIESAEIDRSWSREERENVNAVRAMDHMRAAKPSTPPKITESLIKELHRLYTTGIPNQWNEPGRYRRDIVFAGAQAFAEPGEVPHLMRDFVKFINSPTVIRQPVLIRAIAAHFFLVSIHPFGDGNGRVGRALEAYLLYHGGYAGAGFYSLANYYYRNRKTYIDLLVKTCFTNDGDLTNFTRFALGGFVEELAELNKIAMPYLKAIAFANEVDAAAAAGDIGPRVAAALKQIAASPDGVSARELVARVPDWARILYRGKLVRTIREDLTRIRQSGLVEERSGRLYLNLKT